jgi:hypothetical protein
MDSAKGVPIRDFYPAGDEITLIYETTGRGCHKDHCRFILLPPDHHLVQRYKVMASEPAVNKVIIPSASKELFQEYI